jgi:NAD(P)-dependent dehydrogenase (short-subunit alcohol dehydrogenase family)
MPSSLNTPKTVLITGATDGLGKAAAVLLAARGHRVFAAGRSAERRAQLDALAHDKNLPIQTLELDVREDASVQPAVSQVLSSAAGIDVLVNNAGVSYVATVEDLSMEDWHRQFETNFFGVIRVTQAVAPHMRERRRGRILMMSSVVGLVTPPAQGAYSSSKHALEGLSDALRLELDSFGVQVIVIEPGHIVTGIERASTELSKTYSQKFQSGPYAQLYAAFFSGAKGRRSKSKTTPEDCAKVMLRAIEAPHPKARYGVSPSARLVKWSKRLLPDSAMDAIIRRRFGLATKT